VEPAGVVDSGVLVESAGLEHEDARVTAVDEAARDDGARRPGADDDDVYSAIATGHRLVSSVHRSLRDAASVVGARTAACAPWEEGFAKRLPNSGQ